MGGSWLLVCAAAALCIALAILLARQRREASRLRSRLEAAAMELQRLQVSFARFAPQQLVERIAESGLPTTAEKKEVTVLFADLVGFTALSESIDPTLLVRILNGYFERMTRAIRQHRGHICTLIGDGILALFGALEPNPWQSDDAVHSALAMRTELSGYNRELAQQGLPSLSIGVGLHRGVGVAGLVGSEDLMEFTVVGRTINVAARVQELTRLHDVDILLTQEVGEHLDPLFALRPLPATTVKGISDRVHTFAVLGFEGTAPSR